MNTFQLWTSLSENPVTQQFFAGVFSRDKIDGVTMGTRPSIIVCNTDKSNDKGKHWVCFFIDNVF